MDKKYILNTKNYYRELYIDDKKRPVVVIAPGGAYKYTSERESLPVARFYNANGFHAVVVNYRETIEDKYPLPQKYLAEVLKIVKADKRCSKIIGLGFSAGGHCILDVSLHDYGIKPDLLMLAYPVITSDEAYSHKLSFETLLGDKYNDINIRKYVSLEHEVLADAPDLFLWGTYTDASVNVMNSLLLINEYYKNNLNCEYHMYSKGKHGLALGNALTSAGDPSNIEPLIESWPTLAINWLNSKLGGSDEK